MKVSLFNLCLKVNMNRGQASLTICYTSFYYVIVIIFYIDVKMILSIYMCVSVSVIEQTLCRRSDSGQKAVAKVWIQKPANDAQLLQLF